MDEFDQVIKELKVSEDAFYDKAYQKMLQFWNSPTEIKLDIGGVERLQKLPDAYFRTPRITNKLCHLHSFGGAMDHLPDLSMCKQLQDINLQCCSKLETLPETIGECTALERLSVQNNKGFKYLPSEIGECLQLKELLVKWCDNFHVFPKCIAFLPQLEILSVDFSAAKRILWPPPEVIQPLAEISCQEYGKRDHNEHIRATAKVLEWMRNNYGPGSLIKAARP